MNTLPSASEMNQVPVLKKITTNMMRYIDTLNIDIEHIFPTYCIDLSI
jgi:hypothetical protein